MLPFASLTNVETSASSPYTTAPFASVAHPRNVYPVNVNPFFVNLDAVAYVCVDFAVVPSTVFVVVDGLFPAYST